MSWGEGLVPSPARASARGERSGARRSTQGAEGVRGPGDGILTVAGSSTFLSARNVWEGTFGGVWGVKLCSEGTRELPEMVETFYVSIPVVVGRRCRPPGLKRVGRGLLTDCVM